MKPKCLPSGAPAPLEPHHLAELLDIRPDQLEGILRAEIIQLEHDAESGRFHEEKLWHDSYIAEQHLHLYGGDQLEALRDDFHGGSLGREVERLRDIVHRRVQDVDRRGHSAARPRFRAAFGTTRQEGCAMGVR